MKVGFLFGAGAEISYGLPSGGKFALEIFRQDANVSKELFKKEREAIDGTTFYADSWLPMDFKTKSVSSFGKTVFETIIKDTIEHNRSKIIKRLNDFDVIAKEEESKLYGCYTKSYSQVVTEKIQRNIKNCSMKQEISFIDYFNEGNKLFESNYFSSLLKLYKEESVFEDNDRNEIRKILLSIFQLHIGALSENLTRKINDGIFKNKDDELDLLDDIGDIFQLNYQSTGLSGLEYVMDNKQIEATSDSKLILLFARNVIESIYASVLDYKSLIDTNWHYLYSPKDEWAKFCKISIFLLSVRNYIEKQLGDITLIRNNGYYHDLRKALDSNLLEISTVATTNYNSFIEKVLGTKVTYLNGSTDMWYDPYINRIGKKSDLEKDEKHFLVPLIFTQSGTKPMTSIEMSRQYVRMYENFKDSEKICIIGFGFNSDDDHINGILRTLIDYDDKKLIIFELNKGIPAEEIKDVILKKLKITKSDNINIILVNREREIEEKNWIEKI